MHIAWSFCVALLWAMSTVITKMAVGSKGVQQETRPMAALTTSLIIYASALVSLLLYVALFDRKHARIMLDDIRLCPGAVVAGVVATGVVSSFVANLIFCNLIKHHPVSIVSAIAYTCPVIVATLAYLLLRERAKRPLLAAAGTALTVAGVIMVTLAS
jgi:drug/metabolite transporter (DMT)-like permease